MEKVIISKKLMQRKTKTKTWTTMTRLFILGAGDWPAGIELFNAMYPKGCGRMSSTQPCERSSWLKTLIYRLQLESEKKQIASRSRRQLQPAAAKIVRIFFQCGDFWHTSDKKIYQRFIIFYMHPVQIKCQISWPGCYLNLTIYTMLFNAVVERSFF